MDEGEPLRWRIGDILDLERNIRKSGGGRSGCDWRVECLWRLRFFATGYLRGHTADRLLPTSTSMSIFAL
jgi:hypothetical protein